jgi:hypothetical protein
MDWDNRFNLTRDGDPYERLWWPLLERYFSEWERFWIHHIVPLTNRVDKKHEHTPERLFLRGGGQIDERIEFMLMAHYSVFYFLGRASVAILTEPHLFPEDAFMYLQAACENVARFLTTFTADIAPLLRIEREYLSNIPRRAPHAKKFAFAKDYPFAQINDYRNAFVHWPRLGRNPRLPWEVIPRYEELSLAALSWSHVQGLSEKNFINGREYLQKVRIDLLVFLNGIWKQVRSALDSVRESQVYLACYGLDARGNVRGS